MTAATTFRSALGCGATRRIEVAEPLSRWSATAAQRHWPGIPAFVTVDCVQVTLSRAHPCQAGGQARQKRRGQPCAPCRASLLMRRSRGSRAQPCKPRRLAWSQARQPPKAAAAVTWSCARRRALRLRRALRGPLPCAAAPLRAPPAGSSRGTGARRGTPPSAAGTAATGAAGGQRPQAPPPVEREPQPGARPPALAAAAPPRSTTASPATPAAMGQAPAPPPGYSPRCPAGGSVGAALSAAPGPFPDPPPWHPAGYNQGSAAQAAAGTTLESVDAQRGDGVPSAGGELPCARARGAPHGRLRSPGSRS